MLFSYLTLTMRGCYLSHMILLVLVNLLLQPCYGKAIFSQYAFSKEFIQEIKQRAQTWQAGENFSDNMTLDNLSKLIDLSDNVQSDKEIQLTELDADIEINNHSVTGDILVRRYGVYYKTIHGDVRQTISGGYRNQIVYGNVYQKISGGYVNQIVHGNIEQTVYGGNIEQTVDKNVYQVVYGGNLGGEIFGNVQQKVIGGNVNQIVHGKVNKNIEIGNFNERIAREINKTTDNQVDKPTVHEGNVPQNVYGNVDERDIPSELIDLSDNVQSDTEIQFNELDADIEINNHTVTGDILVRRYGVDYITINGDITQTIYGGYRNQIVYGNVYQKIFGGIVNQIVHGNIEQTVHGGNIEQTVDEDVYQVVYGGNLGGEIFGNVRQTIIGGNVHQIVHGTVNKNFQIRNFNERVESEINKTTDNQVDQPKVHERNVPQNVYGNVDEIVQIGDFNDSVERDTDQTRVDKPKINEDDIPESFDARHFWPQCKNIGKVYDQGACSSSYAFAVAPAFSDRLCILSKGKLNDTMSIEYLLSCCHACKFDDNSRTCGSGQPITAWWFLHKKGIISGGDYNSNKGCQPLSIAPCERRIFDEHEYSCEDRNPPELRCDSTCTNGEFQGRFHKDKHHAEAQYYVDSKVTSIQQEIMSNGPVTAQITLYEDFFHYKSGVYVHVIGERHNHMHTAKLIGWGTEDGLPYWLLVNSWGEKWGDKGTFKILRGAHECNIEFYVTAAVPKLD